MQEAHSSRTGSAIFSKGVASQMQDALFTEFCCSNIPPMRLKVLRTIAVPSNNPRCMDQDCHNPTCKGNRMVVLQVR